MTRKIKLIGSAIGNCGRINGCEFAPVMIAHEIAKRQKLLLDTEIVTYKGGSHDVLAQQEFFNRVANTVKSAISNNEFPVMLGGDHSCAIGTWSGVYAGIAKTGHDLGLIWVDAHMDAHRPDTSDTGNLHGMPAAHLLGHGHKELITILNDQPKLKPENIIYFGIRSYETAEEDFLKKLGIKVYYQDMLNDNNFIEVFLNEYKLLAERTGGNVGISLDLDGLNPEQIKAVGTPVESGISSADMLSVIDLININDLIAFEIAEYNPSLDDGNTMKYMMRLLKRLIGRIRLNNQEYE